MKKPGSLRPQVRQAMARSVGLAAFVYGYPLTEIYRTCYLQTGPNAGHRLANGDGLDLRLPFNTVHHRRCPATPQDRAVVTPSSELLYSTAWIHLANGPQLLTVPSSAAHPGRYFVLALYDAYTESIENLGPRTCAPEGETVLLVGPDGQVPEALQGCRVVRCRTHLVWLIARILVTDDSDWPAAHALQVGIALAAAPGTPVTSNAVQWIDEPVNAMAAAFHDNEPAARVAPGFFTNFCRALAEAPGREEDRELVAWIGQIGLLPQVDFAWDALDEVIRTGLVQGFAEGVALVAAWGRKHRPKAWTRAVSASRYDTEYLDRARVAHLCLGALTADEAVSLCGHLDIHQQPLDGRRRYALRFAAGDMPPASASWSVTLYDADRFLHPNPLGRHAIGDRTTGLRREADGSLQIDIGHVRPACTSNWLPAPAGPFHLVLRLYHPRDGVERWLAPGLLPLEG